MKDERYLRFNQNDKLPSYEELLEKDGSFSVHHRNIQSLAIEMLQIKHGQSHEIVYTGNTKVEFQKKLDCRIPSVNTVFHGSENTSYQDPKNREIVPVKINEFISLNNAKKEIRNWVPQNCPCRHRKQYLIDVVFFHDI